MLPLDEARRGLTLLRERGLRAINFAGGEPFLEMNGLYVGELSRFCKKELGVPHVSIITNGSLVSLDWLETFSPFVDLLGVSVDSFDESVNVRIGRSSSAGASHVDRVFSLARRLETFSNALTPTAGRLVSRGRSADENQHRGERPQLP